MPEIVEQGYLYKVYPPLYRIADPEHPFIGNRGELAEICMKKIVKFYKVRLNLRNSDYMNKNDLWQFLYDTIDYLSDIKELYDFYKIDRGLIEIVIAGLVIFGGVTESKMQVPGTNVSSHLLIEKKLEDHAFIRDFMKFVQKKYPEINLEGNVIRGVVNGGVVRLHINQRFVNKIDDLIPVVQKYGYEVYSKEKDSEEQKLTIMEFLDRTSKLTPKIMTRFKGLGEADADQLWDTTLNPENRTLVRLTFDDIEHDIEIFNKLKSDKPFYQKQRKEMFEGYKIRRDDLDN
jgi:DNA gyrase/topoisomerase IV subunit B